MSVYSQFAHVVVRNHKVHVNLRLCYDCHCMHIVTPVAVSCHALLCLSSMSLVALLQQRSGLTGLCRAACEAAFKQAQPCGICAMLHRATVRKSPTRCIHMHSMSLDLRRTARAIIVDAMRLLYCIRGNDRTRSRFTCATAVAELC
jgi:hypothetical protein